MEISAGQAVAQAVQAKAGVAESEVAVALAAKQLESGKTAGKAIVDLLASARSSGGPGQIVNIRV